MLSGRYLSDINGAIVAKQQAVDLHKWAMLGATLRLEQLSEEMSAIFRAFPGLRQKGRPGRRANAVAAGTNDAIADGPVRKRRRTMSAAGRKRISDAQKARWAKQKAQGSASSSLTTGGNTPRSGGKKR